MIENNKTGECATQEGQHQKLNRALRYVLNIDGITRDEYLAILQLMNTIDDDACLVLDNSHEDI